MNKFFDEQISMRRRIGELERRLGSMSRIGVVREVDPAKGVARVALQDGENGDFLTPFIPWEEAGTGLAKTHMPPSVGQQVTVRSPTGDLHDASIQGGLNSDANPRPSAKGDEYVLLQIGAALISVKDGGDQMVFEIGGVSLTLSASGLEVSGGTLTHNSTDVGDTHTHSGVLSGPADTATPN